MDSEGQVYFGADGDIPPEDKKRLDEALLEEREKRAEWEMENIQRAAENLEAYRKEHDEGS